MSTIDCPLCDREHDPSRHPDHLSGAWNGQFEFKCEECAATFVVHVDYSPSFWIDGKSVKAAGPLPGDE